MAGDVIREDTAKNEASGSAPENALSAAFVRAIAEAGRYCDGQRTVPPGRALGQPAMDSAALDPRPTLRARLRWLPAGVAEGGTRPGLRQPASRAGRCRPARREAARKATPTFADSAARVARAEAVRWRNPKHAHDWPASLDRFAFPRFGDRPVSEVSSADVLGVLAPIWPAKPETARSVRQRIGAVMQWTVAMDYQADNPCDRVAATLGRQRDVVRHHSLA